GSKRDWSSDVCSSDLGAGNNGGSASTAIQCFALCDRFTELQLRQIRRCFQRLTLDPGFTEFFFDRGFPIGDATVTLKCLTFVLVRLLKTAFRGRIVGQLRQLGFHFYRFDAFKLGQYSGKLVLFLLTFTILS